jgi:membrane protease YdiL (CAAX protease family)
VSSFPPPTPPGGLLPGTPAAATASGPAAPGALAAVPWWIPFAAFVAALIAGIVASVIAVGVAAVGGAHVSGDNLPTGVLVAATIVQDASLIVVAALGTRLYAGSNPLRRLGWRRPSRGWAAVGWAVLAIVVFFLVALIVSKALGEPDKQDLVKDLEKEDSLAALLGFGLVTVIAAPLAEETFFRGFLFGTLRTRMPTWLAVVITGAVFGSVHLPAPGQTILVLAVLGALLCLVYLRTGSLLPCFALHAFVNSITFASTKHFSVAGGAALVIGAVGTVVVTGAIVSARRTT